MKRVVQRISNSKRSTVVHVAAIILLLFLTGTWFVVSFHAYSFPLLIPPVAVAIGGLVFIIFEWKTINMYLVIFYFLAILSFLFVFVRMMINYDGLS